MDGEDSLQAKVDVCYPTHVSNGNAIWKSENILISYLPVFSAQVSLMIITTRFLYYLLRPFNQPRFIIEMMIGFILSPDLLGDTPFFKVVVPPRSVLSTETISHVGLIYYVFLAGLDMNIETILQARKKATSIAIAGIIMPMAMGGATYALLQNMYEEIPSEHVTRFNTSKAYMCWALITTVTGFPIVTQILADLKLLYTGLGREALTAAMISDFLNWVMFALLVPFALDEKVALYSVLSTVSFVLLCFIVVRPYLAKLITRKTDNNEWDNAQLCYVVIGAYVFAAITDILGTHPVVGALVYGIMIPRGKFTDMLIDKTEDFGVVYLATLFFGSFGIRLRIIGVIKLHGFFVVAVGVLSLCIPKIVSTVLATQFFGMPALDGVAIGLLMNTKGILPLIMLNIAWDKQILSVESFSVMVTSIFVMTTTVPVIINAIYNPRKLYRQNKLRTIQNLRVEAELRVLACVHNPRQTGGMLNILEACNAIKQSSLRIFALQLVEITGTATSLIATHAVQQQSGGQAATKSEQELEIITNTFDAYAEQNENTSVETLAAVSTYSTIHGDIHNVAREKQTSLILLPFHKHSSVEGVLETTNEAYKNINHNVLRDAPCSVGIFIDRGLGSLFKVNLRVLMLFIGGPDDREALALAWRMSKHQGIQLSVVRILLLGEAGEVDSSPQVEFKGLLTAVVDNEKQKDLDDEYVNLFRQNAVNNEDSISYSEKEVHTGEDIPQVLNQLDQKGYELYVLGQGTGRNSYVLTELMKWTDCPELGVIGDMVASNNFGSRSSLLVIQQYGFGGMVFQNTTQHAAANKLPATSNHEPLSVKIE